MTMTDDEKTASHSKRKVEPQRWLWQRRIPGAQITLYSGETGAGKSLGVTDMIARVTKGAKWPDGAGSAPRGEVLVISEDPVESMQNPRLLAAGADLTRVRYWKGPFSIDRAEDLAALKADLTNHPKTKLVVIDPLPDCMRSTSYHGVRNSLLKLRDDVAIKHNVAIVAMGHPPKGLPVPLDSFGGSRGIPSVARGFWMFVREDDDRHLMLFVKCNVSNPVMTGLAFKVGVKSIPAARGKPIEAPHVVWDEEPVMMIAMDWWHSERGRRNQIEPKRAKDIAIAFLKMFLEAGPKLADEVMQAAAGEAIKRGTLQSARMELGLIVEKQPGIAHGPWRWSLPATKPEKPSASPEEPTPKPKRKKQKTNVVQLFPTPKVQGGGGPDGGDAA
jgi:putative DNA primase/helicase